MTLSILVGLIQIIWVEAVIGTIVLAISLWWATCQRLAKGNES